MSRVKAAHNAATATPANTSRPWAVVGDQAPPRLTTVTQASAPPRQVISKAPPANGGATNPVENNASPNAAPAVTPDQVARLRNKLVLDAHADGRTPATPMSRPGPNTLGTADTDSRDNGGAQAGRAAPASDAASAASAAGGG